MEYANQNIAEWLTEARRYDEAGDVYHAVKLYKLVLKADAEQVVAYERLGELYKRQLDWKACLHYNKKAIALSPTLTGSWWNLGIAATAMKKWKLAQSVWNKFGYQPPQDRGITSIRLRHDGGLFEITGAELIDPARARIRNIPHPLSGCQYGDLVLIDGTLKGYHVSAGLKVPVYDFLCVVKPSNYQTYPCFLYDANEEAIHQLRKLCRQNDLGFENWSLAWWFMQLDDTPKPEYLNTLNPTPKQLPETQVAIASPDKESAETVLRTWQIISGLEYFLL